MGPDGSGAKEIEEGRGEALAFSSGRYRASRGRRNKLQVQGRSRGRVWPERDWRRDARGRELHGRGSDDVSAPLLEIE